ncbi:hypothetical protein K2Y11_24595 [bacterium]|nr:hypothetical protein [bacterium]
MKKRSKKLKDGEQLAVLPFAGFDNPFWDEVIGEQLAFEGSNLASADDDEDPLDEDIYRDLIDGFWNPAKGLVYLSTIYAKSFGEKILEKAKVSARVEFESLDLTSDAQSSPDRIFVKMTKNLVVALFEMSAAKEHKRLARECIYHFQDRGNYYSSYDPDHNALLAKPVEQWDHNELLVLICATIGNNVEGEIRDDMVDGGHFLEAFWRGVNKQKFEHAIKKAKREQCDTITIAETSDEAISDP